MTAPLQSPRRKSAPMRAAHPIVREFFAAVGREKLETCELRAGVGRGYTTKLKYGRDPGLTRIAALLETVGCKLQVVKIDG